ncbi:MAG: DNA mismatch repair endonuclease MutL [Mariprofundaceae bacterium]
MSEPLIHILPALVANQIAAGEAVERPASVVKELVENSLDAGATVIRISIQEAGKKLIEVDDNGSGMGPEDAEIALKRHATSKISTVDDIYVIASHGFRGEALPSIASVSRFILHTSEAASNEGVKVIVNGGNTAEVQPAPPRAGALIRVQDLFFNTPARRRFLRTDRTEEAVIIETVRSLALCNPLTGFRLSLNNKERLNLARGQSRAERVASIMGPEFGANSYECSLEHEGILVQGSFSLPTYHHRDGSRMLIFVNGRVIRDRMLLSSLKAGYRDVLFHDRFPQAVVWLEMDSADVDVNVHPSKREVRFKSPQRVRSALVACVRAAIEKMGQTVSTTANKQALESMRSATFPGRSSPPRAASTTPSTLHSLFSAPAVHESERNYEVKDVLNLGVPLAQIHRCYILAQTDTGIILIDQHAAAERISYEKMKQQLNNGELLRQMLLKAESWQPDARVSAWLHEHAHVLSAFGFEVEPRGDEAFVIRSMPAILRDASPMELVSELTDAVMAIGAVQEGSGRILERWLGNRACKGAIKSGHLLKHEEQEALLRQMEQTPNIAQCNHGRPTYVRLSLLELERMFGRKE